MGLLGKKTAILKYFKDSDQKLSDFMKELKELSKEETLELAQGSAKELGSTKDQVDFPLD